MTLSRVYKHDLTLRSQLLQQRSLPSTTDGLLTAPRSLLSVLLSGLYTLIFQNKKGHTLDCRFCCHWDRLESKQALLCHDGLTSQGKRPLNSTVFCVQTIKLSFFGSWSLGAANGRPYQPAPFRRRPSVPRIGEMDHTNHPCLHVWSWFF